MNILPAINNQLVVQYTAALLDVYWALAGNSVDIPAVHSNLSGDYQIAASIRTLIVYRLLCHSVHTG